MRLLIFVGVGLSVLLTVVFGVVALAAASRYFEDTCNGPDSLTSDCQDAFSSMWLGAIVTLLALVAAAICVRLLLRRSR